MEEYIWKTVEEINMELAKRVKNIRKRRGITQKELSDNTGISYGSIKWFELTGNISLISLTKIALELGYINEIKSLFTNIPYRSIEEVLKENRKKI